MQNALRIIVGSCLQSPSDVDTPGTEFKTMFVATLGHSHKLFDAPEAQEGGRWHCFLPPGRQGPFVAECLGSQPQDRPQESLRLIRKGEIVEELIGNYGLNGCHSHMFY